LSAGGDDSSPTARQTGGRNRPEKSDGPCAAPDRENGLGRAYLAGFHWALARDYEFIFEMDGDFSHNPDDIPAFLQAPRERTWCWARVTGMASRHQLAAEAADAEMSAGKYVRFVTGMPFSDPTGGYKCFRRRALLSVKLDEVRSNGYSFQIEMTHQIWRQGMKVVEVPIIFTDRFQGSSKMSSKIVREAFVMVWRLLFQNNLRRSPRPKRKAAQD